MNHFYRYVRPLRLDEKRFELRPIPHGGICLRFEELPEGDLFFTYSRCHSREFFNKDVARVIADDRAVGARSDVRVLNQLRCLPYSQNTDLLINAVIRRCRQMDVSGEHPLVQRYMQLEYLGFADVLEQLVMANDREQLRAAAWKKGMTDIGRALYQGLNK